MKLQLILITLFLSFSVLAQYPAEIQQKVDSLENALPKAKNDTTKIKILNKWSLLVYSLDLDKDLELNYQIDSICNKNLSKKLKAKEKKFFQTACISSNRNISTDLRHKGKYKEAIERIQISLKFAEETNNLDEKSAALNFWGVLCGMIGEDQKGIDLMLQSYAIDSTLNDTASMGKDLSNLGNAYDKIGEWKLALDYLNKAMEISAITNDLNAKAATHINIGIIQKNHGFFKEAEENFKQAEEIYTAKNDKSGIEKAAMASATLYVNSGEYQKAYLSFKKAADIAQEIGDQVSAVKALANIGVVFQLQSNLDKALEYFLMCYPIIEQLGSKYMLGIICNNIGACYRKMGQLDKAEEYLLRAKQLGEEAGDKKGVAMAINNLGVVYTHSDPKKALIQLEESLKQKIEAEDPQGQATTYVNMANAYQAIATKAYRDGNKTMAEENFNAAFGVLEKCDSLMKSLKSAELIRRSSNLYLEIYIKLDSAEKAKEYALKLMDYRRKDMEINFPTFSEKEKANFINDLTGEFNLICAFSMKHPELADLTSAIYNYTLLSKGLLLRSSSAMRNTILNTGDSTLIQKYQEWIDLRKEIAKAYASNQNIEEMEKKANEMERALALLSNEFSSQQKIFETDWKIVQSGLKNGEAAIEFIQFEHGERPMLDTIAITTYAALIVTKNSKSPKLVRLFNEPELSKIIGTFPGNNLSYIEQVYGSKKNTKTQLYDLIWKPMEKELTGNEKIYLSPVGLLHKISFSAIAKKQNVYLCDNTHIQLKSTTGKVGANANENIMKNPKAMLFGGVQYSTNETKNNVWTYLKGTLSETQQIAQVLTKNNIPVRFFQDTSATETKFKNQVQNSTILHVATHGFFFPDPKEVKAQLKEGTTVEEDLVFRGEAKAPKQRSIYADWNFIQNSDPLMRSGFVLYGANDVWERDPFDEGEDGILTASEISNLDLRKTDLVILSACETGLGDIKGSEGVYGLQRSFKVAGVKYLVMSLWQVPDKETAEFMTKFYENLIQLKDLNKAFEFTQSYMRKKYDPYFWAAFVLVD
ncbi:MAG: CHAT domain-containing protein [Crocinitomicaceae bacterium]|nr:CHAT domain-containing protein [Crocinitomicaceae bacterium]